MCVDALRQLARNVQISYFSSENVLMLHFAYLLGFIFGLTVAIRQGMQLFKAAGENAGRSNPARQ